MKLGILIGYSGRLKFLTHFFVFSTVLLTMKKRKKFSQRFFTYIKLPISSELPLWVTTSKFSYTKPIQIAKLPVQFLHFRFSPPLRLSSRCLSSEATLNPSRWSSHEILRSLKPRDVLLTRRNKYIVTDPLCGC